MRSSLQGLSALKGINSSSQLSVVSKLKWSLESYIQVVNEDVEENRDSQLNQGTSGMDLKTWTHVRHTSILDKSLCVSRATVTLYLCTFSPKAHLH